MWFYLMEFCNMLSISATTLLFIYCTVILKTFDLSFFAFLFCCCFIFEHITRNKKMRFYYFLFLFLNLIGWLLNFRT